MQTPSNTTGGSQITDQRHAGMVAGIPTARQEWTYVSTVSFEGGVVVAQTVSMTTGSGCPPELPGPWEADRVVHGSEGKLWAALGRRALGKRLAEENDPG
jgi:hypothetical protein